jgi:microsomal dipeptidase-like Zn-dependent dipeptidase
MGPVARRGGKRRKGTRVLLPALLALGLTAAGLAACQPPPSQIDIYAFAGRCWTLKDETSGRFVAKDALGWVVTANQSRATPFTLQATGLGRYLFYGPGGAMPSVGPVDVVTSTTTPGPAADWIISARERRVSFRSVSNNRGLTVTSAGRLGHSSVVEARWSLVTAGGCTAFPEVQVNATGNPFRGGSPTAAVRGFVDAHGHIAAFQFLGGEFHCGRPWSPYGVTVALQDCEDHQPNGAGAVAENFFTTGTPVGTHSTQGWPAFDGWPRPESLTHEGTYWKSLERAWRGGQRLIVNLLVQNRALCEIYPLKSSACNDMESIRIQAREMFALQDYIDAQFRGPGKGFLRIVRSPAEARRAINDGKLAVVLGTEVSEVLDCGLQNDVPQCTAAEIDAGLDELYAMGVRSVFPIHKFDNALGGTAMDSGATGILVNLGNKYATGRWWQAGPCPPGSETDKTPDNLTSGDRAALQAIFGAGIAPAFDDFPAYGAGPLCNVRGLTALGAHAINAMIDRGMLVETDHMSARARDAALDILEARHYPGGVVTSHSWGGMASQQRIQNLGGFVAPAAKDSPDFVESWQMARAMHPAGAPFGVGFGSDMNGLAHQADPRGASANPVTYPYRTFDGGTTMDRQRSGSRVWDINTDGVAQYGLFPDYVEDLRKQAGNQIVTDLANGAELYLQMWARAEAFRSA